MANNKQVGRINQGLEAMLKTGLMVLRSDGSEDVDEEEGEEREDQEEVDDQPGHQPRPGVLPDGCQEDELCDEEGREEEDQIVQTAGLQVLLQELPQHVRLAVEESKADDEGEVCEAPEKAGYLKTESQLHEAERCHDWDQPLTGLRAMLGVTSQHITELLFVCFQHGGQVF